MQNIIKHVMYSPDLHAGVAERANPALKERLYKYFSEKNTHRWIDVIQKIADNLNKSVNRTIGMKPIDVTFQNANALRNRLYKDGENAQRINKFKTGDIVRIKKQKGKFDKGYYPNFTDELFKIARVNHTNPPSYRIKDLGKEIKGIFYPEELMKTTEAVAHRAEVVKTRIRRGIKEHFVHWIGYSDQHNSWIRDSDLIKHT